MHSGRAFVIINTQSDIARCQPDGFYQVQGAPFHVSIQAQVINLFQKIQKELGITYVFIAHDLAVVRHIADKIAVMYLGRIVETMDAEDILTHPMHPYTKALECRADHGLRRGALPPEDPPGR